MYLKQMVKNHERDPTYKILVLPSFLEACYISSSVNFYRRDV